MIAAFSGSTLAALPGGSCAWSGSETQESASVGRQVDRQPFDVGWRGGVPSSEVRPEDQPLGIRRLNEQVSALVGVNVHVEPQPAVVLVELCEADWSCICCDPGADPTEQE